jgi:hypothetical protein
LKGEVMPHSLALASVVNELAYGFGFDGSIVAIA